MKTENTSQLGQFIEKMKSIQLKILEYIDCNDDTIEESYQNLIKLLIDQKIKDDINDLKAVLHIILKIANNHNRQVNFFKKIEKLLLSYKEEIKQTFSNYEIFNIFKGNKRVLLFLFDEKILIMDAFIANTLKKEKYVNQKYPHYLYPEIKPFLTEEIDQTIAKQLPKDFEERRRIGENDDPICEIIRKDSIEEFIIYVNKNNIGLSSFIKKSIFETNSYLVINEPILAEYAAFFGSIQIIKYIHLNGGGLVYTMWRYAIHGRDPEVINILEENKVTPKLCLENSVEGNYREAIKCHHNEMMSYFEDKYSEKPEDLTTYCLKYFNFAYLNEKSIDQYKFFDFCQFDHYYLLKHVLKNMKISINAVVITKIPYFNTISFLLFNIISTNNLIKFQHQFVK